MALQLCSTFPLALLLLKLVSSALLLGPTRPQPLSQKSSSDDSDDDEAMVRALRKMGIHHPRFLDPSKDCNFGNWFERTEFYFSVTKCLDDDKDSSLVLLSDVKCFKVAKHLGIKATTDFDEAKKKLKLYFAITETLVELREKLDLRRQEAGQSVESHARDIMLISHRNYPDGNFKLFENILIKLIICGLKDERSKERGILKTLKNLSKAAQYARFS